MSARSLARPVAAATLLFMLAFVAPAAFADTFVVNATDDPTSGACTTTHCSLRQAIAAANALPGPDTIAFDLPATVFRCFDRVCSSIPSPIVVASLLPTITDRVTIDGRTQSQFKNSPVVEIRGGSPVPTRGLTLGSGSDKSVIRSIAVTNFGTGLAVLSSTNLIAGDRIGVDVTGAARGNSAAGVVVTGDTNQIGGDSTNDGNLISGNSGDGVVICSQCLAATPVAGTSGSNNDVWGNLIGTNSIGTAALGNDNGITIAGNGFNAQLGAYVGGVNRTIVGGGGTFADYRNVISGNRGAGVFIENTGGTLVGGNLIGLNAAGTASLANAANGMVLSDTPNTFIGDFGIATFSCTILGRPAQCPLDHGGPNTISGNTGDGIRVFDTPNTHDITIITNNIGTDSGGTLALGNSATGIIFENGVAPAKNYRIGFNDIGQQQPNFIVNNGGAGVKSLFDPNLVVFAPTIRFNQISSNGGLGIDEGVVATTSGAPRQVTAVSDGSTTTVSFLGNTGSTVDFYTNDVCDPSGFGEGTSFLGSTTVTNSFTQTVVFNAMPIGTVLTATQTATNGDTSMFSQCAAVTSAGQTGTFSLSPRVTTTSIDRPLVAALTWTVPASRVWRNLATIDIRLVPDDGGPATLIHWDEASNTLSLDGRPTAFTPGSQQHLDNQWLDIDLPSATVVGTGPTGPSVTLTLPIDFKPHAASHAFRVDVAASDDLGHSDPFLTTGEWHVVAHP